MITDELTEFCDQVAIPASAGTALIGDVMDLQVVRDVGNGEPIYLYAMVVTAATGGTSLQLQLVTDDNAAMSSPNVVVQTAVIALASLTLGRQLWMVALPLDGAILYERYIGIRAVTVGTFTAGAVDVGLTLDPRNPPKAFKHGVD